MAEHAPLRRNRQFQLLWFGTTVSQLGSELTRLAMPLLVLALTGAPGWAGIVAGAGVAASILAQMPAGVWVDRWDRRRTLAVSQIVRTGASTLLATLVVSGHVQLWHLVLASAVDGVCGAFVDPARTTAIRGVVPVEQLPSAYTQEESRRHAARLLGPPLGGLLYGLGRSLPFVADAASFLVALLTSVLAKVPRRPATVGPQRVSGGDAAAGRGMRGEMAEVLGWLWRRRGLRDIYVTVMVTNLLSGAFLLPLIVLVGERGGNALNTGTVLAGTGIGGLIGALLAGALGRLLPPGRLLLVVVAVFGGGLAAMALPLGPWWPMGPMVVITLAKPSLNVALSVVVSRLVPQEMLGRMASVLGMASNALAPLGPLLGGAVAAAFGGPGGLVALGTALLLTAGIAALSPDLRRFTGEEPAVPQPCDTASHSAAR